MLLQHSTRYLDKVGGAVEMETLKHLVTLYVQDYSILYYNEEL